MIKVQLSYLHPKALQTHICLTVENSEENQQICCITGLLYQDIINQQGGHRTFPVKCNTSFSPKCSLRKHIFQTFFPYGQVQTHNGACFLLQVLSTQVDTLKEAMYDSYCQLNILHLSSQHDDLHSRIKTQTSPETLWKSIRYISTNLKSYVLFDKIVAAIV